MKIKSATYQDDGKVETRLKFSDQFTLVVSAPVKVDIETEGETEEGMADVLETLRSAFQEGITKELDTALFQICLGMVGKEAQP